MASFQNMLVILGSFTSAYLLLKLANFVQVYIRPSQLPRYLHSPNGSWAVVTGASDGIGKAFATQLCMRSFNVVIHGRNVSKLENVKQSLLKEYPKRSVKIITGDASRASTAEIESLVASMQDLPITVLINNVGGTGGVLSSNYKDITSHTGDEVTNLVAVNALFATQLTRLLLPILTQNSPAMIMNIGSLSVMGIPYLSVYSGVKGYIRSWSHALAAEMKGEGLDVEVLCMQVGETLSGQNVGTPTLFCPTSRDLASAALDRVGCGKTEVVPYWPHALQIVGMERLPEYWRQKALVREVCRRRMEEQKSF